MKHPASLRHGLLVLTLGLAALPTWADDDCDAPVERWQSREAVQMCIRDRHQVLARQGADLMRDLESAAREETTSWPAVAGNARPYAERLRHNVAVEELALFPVAEEVFSDADWNAIVP